MVDRVIMDEQIFLLQRTGGVSKYFTELLTRLDGRGDEQVDVRVPARAVWGRHLLDSRYNQVRQLFCETRNPHYPPYYKIAAKTLSTRRSQMPGWGRVPASGTVQHHTFYHPGWLDDYEGVPKVSTVHDFIPERYRLRGRFNRDPHMAKKAYVERSDAIIAISDSAKDDLYRFYGDSIRPDTRVETVHLGVGEEFFSPVFTSLENRLPEHYILYVGQRGGYKNFVALAESFCLLSEKIDGVDVVCAGGGGFTPQEETYLDRLGIRNRVHHLDGVADETMPELYARAAVFVQPSFYEGFGLTVLEAMAAGTLVLLAETPALREVGAGGGATFFDPFSIDELADRLERSVRSDAAEREQVISSGRAHATGFTWEECARRTLQVYNSIGE